MNNLIKNEKWGNYYSSKYSIGMYISNIILHLPYLIKIIIIKPKKILEIGCGTATHTIFLSYFLPSTYFVILDKNNNILKNAEKNIKKLKRKNITIKKSNVFSLPFKKDSFDLIISQGLLEHFDNKKMIDLIKESLRISKEILFSVPSQSYPNKDFGDERLLSPVAYRSILNEFNNLCKVKVAYYSLELGIRTKLLSFKKFFRQRLLKSIKSLLLPTNILIHLKKR